jgi:hypothetical protein
MISGAAPVSRPITKHAIENAATTVLLYVELASCCVQCRGSTAKRMVDCSQILQYIVVCIYIARVIVGSTTTAALCNATAAST